MRTMTQPSSLWSPPPPCVSGKKPKQTIVVTCSTAIKALAIKRSTIARKLQCTGTFFRRAQCSQPSRRRFKFEYDKLAPTTCLGAKILGWISSARALSWKVPPESWIEFWVEQGFHPRLETNVPIVVAARSVSLSNDRKLESSVRLLLPRLSASYLFNNQSHRADRFARKTCFPCFLFSSWTTAFIRTRRRLYIQNIWHNEQPTIWRKDGHIIRLNYSGNGSMSTDTIVVW